MNSFFVLVCKTVNMSDPMRVGAAVYPLTSVVPCLGP